MDNSAYKELLDQIDSYILNTLAHSSLNACEITSSLDSFLERYHISLLSIANRLNELQLDCLIACICPEPDPYRSFFSLRADVDNLPMFHLDDKMIDELCDEYHLSPTQPIDGKIYLTGDEVDGKPVLHIFEDELELFEIDTDDEELIAELNNAELNTQDDMDSDGESVDFSDDDDEHFIVADMAEDVETELDQEEADANVSDSRNDEDSAESDESEEKLEEIDPNTSALPLDESTNQAEEASPATRSSYLENDLSTDSTSGTDNDVNVAASDFIPAETADNSNVDIAEANLVEVEQDAIYETNDHHDEDEMVTQNDATQNDNAVPGVVCADLPYSAETEQTDAAVQIATDSSITTEESDTTAEVDVQEADSDDRVLQEKASSNEYYDTIQETNAQPEQHSESIVQDIAPSSVHSYANVDVDDANNERREDADPLVDLSAETENIHDEVATANSAQAIDSTALPSQTAEAPTTQQETIRPQRRTAFSRADIQQELSENPEIERKRLESMRLLGLISADDEDEAETVDEQSAQEQAIETPIEAPEVEEPIRYSAVLTPQNDLEFYLADAEKEKRISYKAKLHDIFSFVAAPKEESVDDKITMKECASMSDFREEMRKKGYDVRQYVVQHTVQYYSQKYIRVNSIKFATSCIVYLLAVALVLVGYFVCDRYAGLGYVPYIATAVGLLIVPGFYGVRYLAFKDKHTPANFSFKLSLATSFMVAIILMMIFLLVAFFYPKSGANISEINTLVAPVFYPAAMLMLLPASVLVYALLYRTRKFYVI